MTKCVRAVIVDDSSSHPRGVVQYHRYRTGVLKMSCCARRRTCFSLETSRRRAGAMPASAAYVCLEGFGGIGARAGMTCKYLRTFSAVS